MTKWYRFFDSSYLMLVVVLIHCALWYGFQSPWILCSTASCCLIVLGITVHTTFFGVQAKTRKELKIQIARLQKTVPEHIPDAQVIKYLKTLQRREKKWQRK